MQKAQFAVAQLPDCRAGDDACARTLHPNDAQILTWLADVNGSKAPREPLQHIAGPGSCQTGGADTGDNAKPPSLRVLLSNWHVARRFFILAYSWMAMCMAYYGISFALGSLGGSLLVSFTIGALAELPSYVVAAWAIEHIGRCVST